jgi:hypothetical protein
MLGFATKVSGALALALIVATPASAQRYERGWTGSQTNGWNRDAFWRDAPRDVWQRITFMQGRIDRGVRDGSLTRNEGRRLQQELNRIRRESRRWRGGANGRYQDRVLRDDDYVYRGSDGRYYCKRSDGTVGLIIGGVTGGVLGNVIDGGRNRTAGTLIGGALGALAGSAIQRDSEVRCR